MSVETSLDPRHAVAVEGFTIIDGLVESGVLRSLAADFGARMEKGTLTRRSNVYGERNLLETSAIVREIACRPEIRSLVDLIEGRPMFAVRALYFDKNPGANWNLGWHQDVTIAVRGQRQTEGFGPWSTKAGIPHVHAPAAILEKMISVRVHIDDCPPENGALRVVPGSHLRGRIAQEDFDAVVRGGCEVVCSARAGSVLLMRPLLLHSSKASTSPVHRRVLHIEYAAEELPAELEWRWRIGD